MFTWKVSLITIITLLNLNYNIYSMATVVVEVDDEYVTCVDFNGNEWSFENTAGDWYEGDFASLTMCDMGTEIVFDDVILSAKYDGWLDGVWGYDMDGYCVTKNYR